MTTPDWVFFSDSARVLQQHECTKIENIWVDVVAALLGRGTLDVKCGVVGLLEAAGALLDEGYTPERTLLLAFGHDEEVGGFAGAGQIAGGCFRYQCCCCCCCCWRDHLL
jgi:hypothetical protein